MRRLIPLSLPAPLLLLGVAVILIVSGAEAAGLVLGLAVAGTTCIVVVSTLLHDVARTPRSPRRTYRVYRRTRAKGF